MRRTALIILGLSAAVTLLSPIIWLVGFIGGIGGSLIHLFLLLTPFGVLGLIVGAVLLFASGRNAQT
ncbi:MAG: hypothetical protein QOD32_1213 [Pyrinomonadaceae bacterium]|jgi:hypothetical protein|nr:hypothetical protein [Pyrinomonadaceae bacterium]